MIFVEYLIVAIGVTFLSIKAADYVDWIDKKTTLSGAFIGGVMLSAVTSLPELFTSISSALMLNEPGLCIGNILGSDLFNCLILAVLMIIAFRGFCKADISDSHVVVLLATLVGYLAIVANMYGVLDFSILTISFTSIIIAACYGVSIKFMSGEDGDSEDDSDDIPLTLKQIITRFVIVSIGIIGLSILISYVTDNISDTYHLGKGIAGALFMGIATSLPELASTIALFRKKNFDIAVGNIVGSNIFNLVIMAVTDVLYVNGGIYDFTDPKTINLLIFGTIAVLLMTVALKFQHKAIKFASLPGIVACYALFLMR